MSVLLVDKSALEWARRDERARAAFLSLRTAHVIVLGGIPVYQAASIFRG